MHMDFFEFLNFVKYRYEKEWIKLEYTDIIFSYEMFYF